MRSTRLAANALFALTLVAFAAAEAPAASDSAIEAAVKNSYVFTHELKNDSIKVSAKDGFVTLTGSVADEHHKVMAEDIVTAQDGVKGLNDKLEVDKAAPAPLSDAWLLAKVKSVLLFHRSVSSIDTDVDVKDGVVTLKGTADSQAQKALTAEYALDVEGVKGVENDLVVARKSTRSAGLAETIDDASITTGVKMALLLHRSTSALNTHVVTKRGAVTLTGTAGSTAEKDLAGKITDDVRGVKSVDNKVRVEKD